MKFEELELKESLLKAIEHLGYSELFPVQEEAWKLLNNEMDCIIQSKTGSGKTLAYALPILQNIVVNEKHPQAIVLCPTRELARQVKQVFDQVGLLMGIKTNLLIGKESFSMQAEDLKQRCHVIVGTPGRIVEHIKENNLKMDKINYLVLDEADEMLNQDFEEDMVFIADSIPNRKNTCLVSATYSSAMDQFVKGAKKVVVEKENDQIEQWGYLYQADKEEFLIQVLIQAVPESCLIFVSTQQDVENLFLYLKEKEISIAKIHGGMEQEERFFNMDLFKKGKVRILIATDVVSRGIDIQKVDMIINYDLPKSKTLHTHRIGRSGRAMEIGCAISFYNEAQKEYFSSFEIDTRDFVFTKSLDDIELLKTSTKVVVDKSESLKKQVCTLFINSGKDKKIRPGDIVGALCQVDGIQIEDIGAIKVEAHQSFVDIYNHKENLVLKNIRKIKSKSVRIERAKRNRE
ncbi:MAG: DEAD/DEAH box helicase [Firmicutes bacterium]|nr:DEAD/DEAH box helicase [Bacillota bacterium]